MLRFLFQNELLFLYYLFKLCQSIAPISYRNIKNQGDLLIHIEINLSPGHVKRPWLTSKISNNNSKITQASLKILQHSIQSVQALKEEEIWGLSHAEKCKNHSKKWPLAYNLDRSVIWSQQTVDIISS